MVTLIKRRKYCPLREFHYQEPLNILDNLHNYFVLFTQTISFFYNLIIIIIIVIVVILYIRLHMILIEMPRP